MRDAVRERAGLKMVDDTKKPETNKPDSLWGAWDDKDLYRQREFLKEKGLQRNERLEYEIARREGKNPKKPETNKPDSLWGALGTDDLYRQREFIKEKGLPKSERLEREIARREGKNPKKPDKTEETQPSQFPPVKGRKGYDPQSQFREPDAQTLGSSAMGTVRRVKGPPPGIVKSGELGQYEAKALEILKGTGVAPELYGQQLSRAAKEEDVEFGLGGHVRARKGYLGMSEAKGDPFGMIYVDSAPVPSVWEQNGKMLDEYIGVRKEIHTRGVAHNDMHPMNFFYDEGSKKGSLVDFGLAQVDSRAALGEALGLGKGSSGWETRGSITPEGMGDWQSGSVVKRLQGGQIESARYKRFIANRARVLEDMKTNNRGAWEEYRDGFIRQDSDTLDSLGLSDSESKRYIDMLYEGV
jgi:hypothetical protein